MYGISVHDPKKTDMPATTQRDRALALLGRHGLMRLTDLKRHGIDATTLSRLVEEGSIARRARGLYELADADVSVTNSLAESAVLVPKGVVCLIAALQYAGSVELADESAWPERLARAAPRDLARRMTTIGPHRDDLILLLGERPLREYGSTGQHRSAAIALKLLELETIERTAGSTPALLLDDVFAELDGERQERLARRLFGGRSPQVFLTAPRAEELPAGLGLPVWRVDQGRITTA